MSAGRLTLPKTCPSGLLSLVWIEHSICEEKNLLQFISPLTEYTLFHQKSFVDAWKEIAEVLVKSFN
jgi:hypothetical protein